MAEEHDSRNQSAAANVQKAVQAGKAVSNIAKGAASGGIAGAAVAAVTNLKGLKTVVLSILAVFLVPILFLLMLPGLIFGGLTEASAPDSTAPILNDSAAISENLTNVSDTLSQVLQTGLEDVLERVQKDYARFPADQIEINNPFESAPVYNANIIISQYCVMRQDDFKAIALNDLERVLRGAIGNLYDYTKVYEFRKREVTTTEIDPVTGKEIEKVVVITEKWAVYTVKYNGEAYFADTIFHLTDQQKDYAFQYAQNLSRFLGDGMFQGILPDEFVVGPSYEGVIFGNGSQDVVYYNQLDPRFANAPYGQDDIGTYGCGPTAMAIVVSTLTSETIDPIQMAAWSAQNGYWCSKSGSYHTLIPKAAEHWNLPWEGATVNEPQKIVNALQNGKLVVAIMGPPTFTKSGHFIVLYGVTAAGNILVADPASHKRSLAEWPLSVFLQEASKNAAAAKGPFWIIG